MSGDLKDMRAYARGYEDGRRSKDADHADVVLKLSRLTFDGGSHENLSKIARAIYPCATGWTCESSKGLRDRLIDLLGGVHEHRCGTGCDCACGDSCAGGHGELAEAMTYEVLGNERHKAVCELRKIQTDAGGFVKALANALGVEWQAPRVHQTIAEVRDRLIHLLGGDEPDLQKSPKLANSGVDDGGKVTITDEFREFVETAMRSNGRCISEAELLGIADRIDAQFNRAMISRSSELGCYKLHINQLEAERDQLRANLEEADAAIANWRERERSFDAAQAKMDAIREAINDGE